MRSIVAGHQKLTRTNWEQSTKLILLKLHEKLLKTSVSTILQLFGIWSKLERWKSSMSGCLMSWPEILKNFILKYSLLCVTTNHFSIRSWLATKSGFYITTRGDQLSGWTKKKLQSTSQSQVQSVQFSHSVVSDSLQPHEPRHTRSPCPSPTPRVHPNPCPSNSKPNVHQKKAMMICCMSDPLQFSESQWNHYIWEYAQQINEMHWKPHGLKPVLVNRKGRILLHDNARPQVTQPMLQKLNELGFEVLPHPPYSSDLLPIDYHFFKRFDNFFQGKRFYNQQEAENAFQEFIESWSMDFNTYFSLTKMCWL